jgi:hypothetical protein
VVQEHVLHVLGLLGCHGTVLLFLGEPPWTVPPQRVRPRLKASTSITGPGFARHCSAPFLALRERSMPAARIAPGFSLSGVQE